MAGTFKLHVDCTPGGPDLAAAVARAPTLVCGNGDGAVTTVTGDTAHGEPLLGNLARDVLYRLSVPAATDVTLSTCGSEYDTYLRLYAEVAILSPDRETRGWSNDDASADALLQCNSTHSTADVHSFIQRTLTPGDWVVVIEGFGANQGPYELRLGCSHATDQSGAGTSPTSAPTNQDGGTGPVSGGSGGEGGDKVDSDPPRLTD